ncbi:hypothetical protein AVEN_215578-1 [Araneus ventricosus]|uniref:Uncharacterized protein n=1 Tax=Araneus ventricosus TaxID=182803 RepID=A0A4Y2NZ01_ARAVE|nr:hypothetical protein AVEN_215578-1 [Araneus ventricosus]
MALKIVLWSSKSPDAQLLPPFFGKLEVGQMRMCFDGRLRPDKVKNEFENVPIPDGLLNFLKKYGEIREDTNELVVDADRITFTDYLPFAFQILTEAFLKSTMEIKENEKPRDEEFPTPNEETLSDEDFKYEAHD